jgi:uncharacterized phiE125 gp8 family phage protein
MSIFYGSLHPRSTTVLIGTPQEPRPTVTPYRSLVVHTKPVIEPVSLAEAKAHCRIDTDDEDAYVQSLITMAREYVEGVKDTALITQTLEARYDLFPLWAIVLPKPPIAPASVTVTYVDGSGAAQTLTSAAGQFQVDHRIVPGRIYPNYNGVWPVPRGDENSVTVRWQAGYGSTGSDVPSSARGVILMLVAHWFEMRQPVLYGYSQVLPVPKTVETLLAASDWGCYR